MGSGSPPRGAGAGEGISGTAGTRSQGSASGAGAHPPETPLTQQPPTLAGKTLSQLVLGRP